ncbi:hypothetical protein GCM10022408_29240 [Hymenobacter fastidiosus]|uniref:Lipocalin-like domain-containing protein n=1 Tax=Hymenobacter fastidiosus TaxID=486264 RepID=A0ABP7SPN9_9BACT
MKRVATPFHYLASLLLFVALLMSGCSQPDKVGETNMLYGTDSKVWKTDKETTATGDKVAQTDADEDTELKFFANGTFNMTSPAQTMQGKYTFDQPGQKITLTPDGATTSMAFDVTNLTEKKITLKGTDGTTLMLEAE